MLIACGNRSFSSVESAVGFFPMTIVEYVVQALFFIKLVNLMYCQTSLPISSCNFIAGVKLIR